MDKREKRIEKWDDKYEYLSLTSDSSLPPIPDHNRGNGGKMINSPTSHVYLIFILWERYGKLVRDEKYKLINK